MGEGGGEVRELLLMLLGGVEGAEFVGVKDLHLESEARKS
jgi:hypothetical protein